jgi:hypothetical protein
MQQIRHIPPSKTPWKTWQIIIDKIPFPPLLSAGLTSLALNLTTNSSISEIALLSTTGLIAGIPFIVPKSPQFKRTYKPSTIGYLLLTGVLFFDVLITPANAQFMMNAENWMSSNFSQAGAVIPLVFNVLRAIFVIYIGYSLFQVINAGRQDEDWKSMAKTPLMVVVAVTVADVLTTMIVGG